MKKKKGVTLIWALVMSTTLLIIAASLADTIMKESKNSIRIQDSSTAYAAAKSGIEIGELRLEEVKKIVPPNHSTVTIPTVNFANGTTADVTLTWSNTDGQWVIGSTGKQGNVARYIENKMVSRTPVTFNFATQNVATYKPIVSGTYSEKFSFWFPTSTHSGQFNFGLGQSASSTANSIFASYSDSDSTDCSTVTNPTFLNQHSFGIYTAKTGSTTHVAKICLGDPSLPGGVPDIAQFDGINNRFYVTIDNINNNVVQLTLKRSDFVTITTMKTVSVILEPSYSGFSNTFTNIYHGILGTENPLVVQDSGLSAIFSNTVGQQIEVSALQIID